MKQRVIPAFLVSLILVAGLAPLSGQELPADYPPQGWITDFNQAKELAQKENKRILLNFTGSDWCAWCFKLRDEIFNTQVFKDYAKDNLILLFLDFPGEFRLPEAQQKQNQLLGQVLGVRGYPTIYVLEPDLSPRLKTGYTGANPAVYNLHLDAEKNIPPALAEMYRDSLNRHFP